jgi:hypothetical protein
MKLIALVTPLWIVAVVASAEIKSADLKQCPNGHTTLKDVPIFYGLPAPEDWTKMQRQIDNLEFVLGGCVVEDDSPTVRPTCTTCRFGYDSRSETWSRRSPDISSFKRPFTEQFRAFPLPPNPGNLTYEQWVRDGRVVGESVRYTMKKDSQLKRQIEAWLSNHAIKAKYTETKEPGVVREWHSPIRFHSI